MERILNKLQNKNRPEIVNIRIEKYSIKDNCFHNVEDKVANDNGQIVYGWKLHKGIFLEEAERHAIWKSPNGELVDVTPDDVYKDKILFLADDKGWVYDGTYSDNVRVNTTNNPLVDDYILLNEMITKLWQTGRRNSRLEIAILEPVAKVITFLNNDKLEREKYILANNNTNSMCYCRQQKLYKDCHGFNLEKSFGELQNEINLIIQKNTYR
jgi:hypothetical protein